MKFMLAWCAFVAFSVIFWAALGVTMTFLWSLITGLWWLAPIAIASLVVTKTTGGHDVD